MSPKQAMSAGFTLLEVMIAVAIIALAIVTLLGAQSQSVSIAGSAKFDTRASFLARWKLADLVLKEYAELGDDAGNFGEDYPEFRWRVRVTELDESETGISGTTGKIKALDIEVHSDLETERAYSLRTFVADVVRESAAASSNTEQTESQSLQEAKKTDE